MPDADALTSKEVRNSIPRILDQMATALAASEPTPLEKLMEITKLHGTERFHESYNVRELIAEYRILRRIVAEEVDIVFEGAISAQGMDGPGYGRRYLVATGGPLFSGASAGAIRRRQ